MSRARQRGAAFVPPITRRLVVLLLIGILHTYLLWFGDILVAYSLLGFVLLVFRNRSDKTILVTSALCLLFPILIQMLLYGLVEWGGSSPEVAVQLEKVFADNRAYYVTRTQQSYTVYTSGTYADILDQRWTDVKLAYLRFLFQGSAFQIFAMFLLGLWAGGKGIFHDAHTYLPEVRRHTPWAIGRPSDQRPLVLRFERIQFLRFPPRWAY